MKRHFSYAELQQFLARKHEEAPQEELIMVGDHLDACSDCWNIWNKVRWDEAMKKPGMEELKQYLGPDFIEYYDSSWAIADNWVAQDPHTPEEVANFYRQNRDYLYNLTVWYESGDRINFRPHIDQLIKEFEVHSVIDYGCGIGNDSLMFLDKGLRVYCVDYNCPSSEYLQWRLQQRQQTAEFLDVDTTNTYPPADMFWAIDVLEHMSNPLETVDKLSSSTKLYVHRSKFNNKAGGRHPCHLNFEEHRLAKALKKKGFSHVPWEKLSVWYRPAK